VGRWKRCSALAACSPIRSRKSARLSPAGLSPKKHAISRSGVFERARSHDYFRTSGSSHGGRHYSSAACRFHLVNTWRRCADCMREALRPDCGRRATTDGARRRVCRSSSKNAAAFTHRQKRPEMAVHCRTHPGTFRLLRFFYLTVMRKFIGIGDVQ